MGWSSNYLFQGPENLEYPFDKCQVKLIGEGSLPETNSKFAPENGCKSTWKWMIGGLFLLMYPSSKLTWLAMENSPFSIGNTSSIRVHFPASHVSFYQRVMFCSNSHGKILQSESVSRCLDALQSSKSDPTHSEEPTLTSGKVGFHPTLIAVWIGGRRRYEAQRDGIWDVTTIFSKCIRHKPALNIWSLSGTKLNKDRETTSIQDILSNSLPGHSSLHEDTSGSYGGYATPTTLPHATKCLVDATIRTSRFNRSSVSY